MIMQRVTTNIMYESKGTKNSKHLFLSIFELCLYTCNAYVCLCILSDILTVCISSECKSFEADWKRRKIENTTTLKTPVTYATVISIRCVGGFEKLSGPDAVTCMENTSFYGLDDVKCHSKYLITFPLGR